MAKRILLLGIVSTILVLAACVAPTPTPTPIPAATPTPVTDAGINSIFGDGFSLAFTALTGLAQYKFRKYQLAAVLPIGAPGDWDETGIGDLSVVRKMSTYYLFYGGWDLAESTVHQIGLATSTDLINWTKEPTNPVLTTGAPGSWDAGGVFAPSVIYFPRTGEWKMWYSGLEPTKRHLQIGLATSSDGINWTKYAGNPVVPMGASGEIDDEATGDPAVIVYKGKYYMVHSVYQGVGLANHGVGLATSPDGITWTKQGGILPYNVKPGSWTAMTIEQARLYHFGDYILGYFAGTSDDTWTAPMQRMGFLLTSDFINWVEFPFNPVDATLATPSPTLPTPDQELIFNHNEDIIYGFDWGGTNGVSLYVLPRKRGSQIPIKMLTLASLAGRATSTLADSLEIDLDQIERLAITVEATYHASATAGIRVHIRTSYDNTNWDTADWDNWIPSGFAAGATIRQTKHYDTDPKYIKVLIENLDGAHPVTDIKVTAVLGAD